MANDGLLITLLAYIAIQSQPAVNGTEIYIYQYGTKQTGWPSVLWMVL